MKSSILNFCDHYKKKLESDESFRIKPREPMDYRDTISFTVGVKYSCMMGFGLGHPNTLITLDDEDLKYLHDKYSKLLLKEMEENIEDVRNAYKEKVGI